MQPGWRTRGHCRSRSVTRGKSFLFTFTRRTKQASPQRSDADLFGYKTVRQCPSSVIYVCNLASFCCYHQPRNRLRGQSVRRPPVRPAELFEMVSDGTQHTAIWSGSDAHGSSSLPPGVCMLGSVVLRGSGNAWNQELLLVFLLETSSAVPKPHNSVRLVVVIGLACMRGGNACIVRIDQVRLPYR
jgi:hypothetical protein